MDGYRDATEHLVAQADHELACTASLSSKIQFRILLEGGAHHQHIRTRIAE